jgi:cytochrome c oxidase subunit 2
MSPITSFLAMQTQAAAGAASAASQAAGGGTGGGTPEYTFKSSMWLPEQVAEQAGNVDGMFYFILGLSVFCLIGITVAVVYFTYKYRARPGHKSEASPSHNNQLEITWTVIPSIIVVFMFIFGWRSFLDLTTPPKNALEIQVKAAKWSWLFTHYNGVEDNALHVPVNKPVRLIMTSQDVLHSFFVPVFRIKQDVVPKRYTQVWFKATKPGTYRLYCTEYCGLDHSQMKTVVVVHEPGGYERYLQAKYDEFMSLPPDQLGKMFYEQKGCKACHTVDGTLKPGGGPSFKGSFGTQIEMTDGSSVLMDENYIRESILKPTAKVHKGFPPIMPTLEISDSEIDALIAYIKSLQQ